MKSGSGWNLDFAAMPPFEKWRHFVRLFPQNVELSTLMNPQDGKAMNCRFALPFTEDACIEVHSEADDYTRMYYYIDYEAYDALA
jgi:hypothetical protein